MVAFLVHQAYMANRSVRPNVRFSKSAWPIWGSKPFFRLPTRTLSRWSLQ